MNEQVCGAHEKKMVRTPCCEKMGLKKGPWTPQEDQILISFVQQFGHGNWRALPKQAGNKHKTLLYILFICLFYIDQVRVAYYFFYMQHTYTSKTFICTVHIIYAYLHLPYVLNHSPLKMIEEV